MTEVTITSISAGHYRIERKDGYSIEVRKESKRKWVNVATGEVEKTRSAFENAVKAYVAPKPVEASKKPKAEKKAGSAHYKGHRNARTAQLHEAFDNLSRSAAMRFAIEELGYTQGGASSWFADWTKLDSAKAPAADKSELGGGRSKAAVKKVNARKAKKSTQSA